MPETLKRLSVAYSDQPVVITGGNGFFGRALATQVRNFGGIPISIDQAESETDTPQFICDIRDADALAETLDEIREAFGPIRFIIANAAMDVTSEAHLLTPEDWRSIIETNLIGTTNLIALTYPDMQSASEGDVLIVSSGSAIVSFPFGLPYTSSKAGQLALSLGLRTEAKKYGVNVSCALLPSLCKDDGCMTGVQAGAKGGADRDGFLNTLPGSAYNVDKAAAAALSGVNKKSARIIFPASLSLSSRLVGLFPGFGAAIRSDIAKRFFVVNTQSNSDSSSTNSK